MALIKCSPGQQWPGFSFALHRHGAGLLFLPCSNTATNKRLQRVLHRQCSYTANAAKQCTELCMGFSCDCTRSTAHDTKPTQAAIIPPAPRWSVSQRRNASSTYQIPAPRRKLYRPAQPPYYNKVYKSAADCKQCQPGGAVQQRGAAGGAEPLTATAVSLFGLSPDSQ